jgi:sterol desaturase/sphingolipid hydroxylase (fatty acid hydroxylase superfamily)
MYGQHQTNFGPILCIFGTCKNTITNPKQAQQDPKGVHMGSTRQILNKPKGGKKERQAVQKGSS